MEKIIDDTVRDTFQEQLLEKLTENNAKGTVRFVFYLFSLLLIFTILFAFFK